MAVQLPVNSTGQVVDTFTTVAGKERQAVQTGSGTPANNFNVVHTPAAATQATITQAAGAAGVRNVCTGIQFSETVGGTLQTLIQVNLRDGTTGAGTILWSISLGGATSQTTGYYNMSITGLNIYGTAATAMTLEFSAGGVAASTQSVSLQGYTTA